ncbi:hypothetical protein [Halomonas sp. KO116]|uniref:hypothetical protein n=1 Tax=Halomonas sp. KO116 TaxID=1504981 RepID=UPI0004E317BD|nr:hypothetical protein [Halomonas sp. KO116]AJY53171.1 hypothetical protein KO116_P200064 [Halomonas sp. KO116]
MQPFKMTMTLASPVVMPFNTTLDGLLSFAGEALTGLRGAKLADVMPLARDVESGIFKASSIFLSNAAFYENLVKVRALKHWDLDTQLIGPKKTKKGKVARVPYPSIDKSRGDYANKLSVMTTLRTPLAACYGVGDIETIELWMQCILGLGRHAQQGQGEIVQLDISPMDADLSWVNDDGLPQRPLPVNVWVRDGHALDGVTTTIAATQFPYWESPLESCVAPLHTVIKL